MKKIKLIIFYFLFFILFANYLNAQIESEKDSLESLLPFAKDYQRVDIFIALADIVKQTDTAMSIDYAKQSFKISNKIGYSKGLAGAHIILGYIDINRSDFKNAKINYLYALSNAIKSNDLNTISWAYLSMGNFYFIQSNYLKAMNYYMGALRKGEKSGNKKRIATAFNQIGSLYLEIKDTNNAGIYYAKAYSILKNNVDQTTFATVCNNLGNLFKITHQEMRALNYYNQSLEVLKKNNSQINISTVLNNMGEIYLTKKNYMKALQFVIESYNRSKLNLDYNNMTTSSLNFSSIYLEMNKIDSALYFSIQSLDFAKSHKYSLKYIETCKQLSKIYELKGDNDKYLYYLRESTEKQISSTNNSTKIESQNSSNENAKKDQETKLSDFENKKNEINIINNESGEQFKYKFSSLLIFIVVFLVLITVLLFYLLTQKKKREKLEISLAAKSNILHRINQELRIPLNSLMSYSYLANESKNLTELREYLLGINASGSYLTNSMNNIVCYLQIESKNNLVINAPFNLNETLQSIFKDFQIQCSQKNILFSQLISPDLPHFIVADSNKITTIIRNILYNSLKFSEKGVVKIEIKLLKTFKIQSQLKGSISIAIIDEGRGLNGKKLKDLVSLNSNKNINNEGFGLGLFIVNNLVEELHGSFELFNNDVAGCTAKIVFDIEIDVLKSNNQIYVLENKKYEKLNILLVENDLINCQTLQKILKLKGHEVSIVLEYKEVISKLYSSKFDMVLIDVSLSNTNAIEITKLIRLGTEFSDYNDIPIIGLSANADPLQMKECLEIGMNDFITKPINIELLLHKMNGLASN